MKIQIILLRALCMGILLVAGVFNAPGATTTLIPANSIWKYLDIGANLGTAWVAAGYNDSTWSSGPAQLGYGDGDEATVVGYGPNSSSKYITTYFRRAFTVTDAASITGLILRVMRDDGAVVYLNGVEVWRSNMPSGNVSYTTLASTAIGGADESAFNQTTLAASAVVEGVNILAVEIHQSGGASSDISFDLELLGTDSPELALIVRGPYLQSGSPSSVVLRWRTDMATGTRVRYGTDPQDLSQTITDSTSTTEHVVTISGLQPDTRYYYEMGSLNGWFEGDAFDFFTTSPVVGTAKPTRVWALGDSGTADVNAQMVRNGFLQFTASRQADLLLMLGDNAYNNGTDSEYQAAVFDMYPTVLQNTILWPTLGNHDTAGSVNPSPSLPYFNMFSLPTDGVSGGLASGTEKYYSFDYGNIHFICLDSMSSDRSPTGPMLTWLAEDLASTSQEWVVAFWHHPPYTKGSHNSDTETELVQMRANALPILENGGVDLVLAGHSHSYERSFLLDGHYGTSGTLTQSMKKDGGDGRESGTGAYQKPAGLTARQGAVYTVAGASGKLEGGPLNHPAMYLSANVLGSVVLDVSGGRLDAYYVRTNGTILDQFTILKEPIVPTIPAAPSGLTAEAASTSQIVLNWVDNSNDEVGFQIERSLDGQSFSLLATVGANVVDGTDSGLTAATTYYYRVRAFNSAGESAFTDVAMATTDTLFPPPAPDNVTAVAANARVDLSWTASSGADSYTVKRATTPGGSYIELATGLSSLSYQDFAVVNGTTYFYVVAAVNAAGNSPDSEEVSATPQAPPPPPSAPTGLTATAVSSTRIDLAWTDASANETGFQLERSVDEVNWIVLTPVLPPDTSSAMDTSVAAGTTYFYRALAFNSGGYSAASETASATTFVDSVATSETTPSGTITGTYADTWADDGVRQQLSETSSGGRPSSRYSLLEHQWAMTIPAGRSAALHLQAHRSVSSDGDSFVVAYSADGNSFVDLLTITATSDTGTYQTAALPNNLSGTVYLRVRDTDRTVGNTSLDTLFVDHLFIRSDVSPLTTPPAEPVLQSAMAGDQTVALDWSASDGATSYRVYRRVTGDNYSSIPHAEVSSGTQYVDTLNVVNGTTYYYVVTAANNIGESLPSNELSATPQASAQPLPPTNLQATPGKKKNTLSWEQSLSAGITQNLVYRSTDNVNFDLVASPVATTSYNDTGLTSGVTYYYYVKAVSASGESEPSNTASGTAK